MAQPWHGRLAWHELVTTDPQAAEGFYGKVVGWTAQPFPGMETPYSMWMNGEQPWAADGDPGGGEVAGCSELAATWRSRTPMRRREGARARREGGMGPARSPGVGFAISPIRRAPCRRSCSRPTRPPTRARDGTRAARVLVARARHHRPRGGDGLLRRALRLGEADANDMGDPVGVLPGVGRPGLPLGGIYTRAADDALPLGAGVAARAARALVVLVRGEGPAVAGLREALDDVLVARHALVLGDGGCAASARRPVASPARPHPPLVFREATSWRPFRGRAAQRSGG